MQGLIKLGADGFGKTNGSLVVDHRLLRGPRFEVFPTTAFQPEKIVGFQHSGAMEPSCRIGQRGEHFPFAESHQENVLGDLAGSFGIPGQLAERRAEHEAGIGSRHFIEYGASGIGHILRAGRSRGWGWKRAGESGHDGGFP
jgi:hypothetical protein